MPEIGRNAPCPCGSGRKFKQCCRTRGPLPFDLPRQPPETLPATTLFGFPYALPAGVAPDALSESDLCCVVFSVGTEEALRLSAEGRAAFVDGSWALVTRVGEPPTLHGPYLTEDAARRAAQALAGAQAFCRLDRPTPADP